MATVLKPKRSFTATSVPATGDLVQGEIAVNFADKKFYGKDSNNAIVEIGGAAAITLQQVTASGFETTNPIKLNNSDLVFEGTSDAYETYVRAVNPTSDNTVLIPNVSGTIVTTGNLTNATGEALSTEGDSLAFAIVFGG
tara:strand:- start:20709 stop:21128 length:420 start_codon:yes stop_codon:yes gene_type:complete